jgi:pimeloyl-ACP methyl ester carboxylesterase
LVNGLKARFTLNQASANQPGNLLLFPYDWRLSNVLSASRLAETASRELDRWRKYSKNPNAKLVLICHSMGGLVARWFLEVLGGREITRQLVTIGTPYQGSVNALRELVNGLSAGLGRLSVDLTAFVRSLPSLYQLLPTYPCLDLGDGIPKTLEDAPSPDLEPDRVRAAAAFHRTIAEQIKKGGGGYEIIAIKGHVQPTAQSALLRAGRIESINAYQGVDHGGDGTVPRPSSHPPEWDGDTRAVFAAQKHASLQNTESVLHQLFGALTGQLGKWMGGENIGVDVPSVVSVGGGLTIRAWTEAGDATLALQAVVMREDGVIVGEPQLLDSDGDGGYDTRFSGLAAGTYRIRVESAVPQRPVEPVTDITLVWDNAEGA